MLSRRAVKDKRRFREDVILGGDVFGEEINQGAGNPKDCLKLFSDPGHNLIGVASRANGFTFNGGNFTMEWFGESADTGNGDLKFNAQFFAGDNFPSDNFFIEGANKQSAAPLAYYAAWIITSGGGQKTHDGNSTPTTYQNVKLHVAWSYDGAQYRLFANGVQMNSFGSIADTWNINNKKCGVGIYMDATAFPLSYVKAREFAFSKVCRYTMNFVPPDVNGAMPVDGNTAYYWPCREGQGLDVQEMIHGSNLLLPNNNVNPWGVWTP